MAESVEHKKLVNLVYNTICEMVPSNRKGLIMVDSDKTPMPCKVFNGVIPDVYYCDSNVMIIGEAKTIKDFERKHSIYQYANYIETIEAFDGKGTLIICVHWEAYFSMQKTLKRLLLNECKKGQYIVLSSNGNSVIL